MRDFIEATKGKALKLTRDQRGRFLALCWTGQIFRHFDDPKPSYVADWDDLPQWQQRTDAHIFDDIARRSERGPQPDGNDEQDTLSAI